MSEVRSSAPHEGKPGAGSGGVKGGWGTAEGFTRFWRASNVLKHWAQTFKMGLKCSSWLFVVGV